MTQMPKGMRLKSEGFASSLYDPDSAFTLAHFCKERDIPYADVGVPVSLQTFIDYGLEFQNRFVPELEDKLVRSLVRQGSGFRMALDDGEEVSARAVIVAVGISDFSYLPPLLAQLPTELVSHSSRHSKIDQFRGREVAVVGAGASALDLAALLHEGGASVQLIARKPAIRFHDPPNLTPKTLFERLGQPATGIGPGWKLYFCAYAPWAFRRLPQKKRLEAVKKILGPAPGWFIKEQVVGKFPFHLGSEIAAAEVQGDRVKVELADAGGERNTLSFDHVIAATGYRVNLQRLVFLDSDFRSGIRSIEQTPLLSSNFESSIPGLYFVGTSAANTFGPLMRFAYGAGFAARRISSRIAKLGFRKSAPTSSIAHLTAVDRDEVGIRN
jgi:cation diffusion facilitator CzcD-associated flavoprotein CzcO